MGKEIKMVWTSPDNCIFLYGINEEGEVVFRSSRNIKLLQSEKPVIEKNMCYLNLYFFQDRKSVV